MTTISGAESTPDRVAKLATTERVFERGTTELIGLFGPANAMSALIRTPIGTIRRVEIGEALAIGRVVAIDDNGIMLQIKGQNHRLSLPSG